MSGPLFSAICLLLQIFLSKTQQQRCRKFHGSLWQISSIFFQAKKMAFVLPSHLQLQILVQSYFSITFSGSQHCTANLKAALLLTWLMTAGYNSASIDILDPRKLSWDSYPQPSLTAVCQSLRVMQLFNGLQSHRLKITAEDINPDSQCGFILPVF